MTPTSRSDIRQSRLVFGYLPLLLVAAAVIVMVFVAPSDRDNGDADGAGAATAVVPTQPPTTAAASIADSSAPASDSPSTAAAGTDPAGTDASGTAPAGTDVADSVPPPPDGDPNIGTTASGWGTSVTACGGRTTQVFSGYSPPCFEFTGGNGGATARGVTTDTITVSYRYLTDGHLVGTLSALGGNAVDETADDLWRTTEGLIDYFNANYQFYGRQIELERFDGTGSLTAELTGGGQEGAAHDALVAIDLESFADVDTGLQSTQPYAEALAANGVITIGANYMSREWFQERAPFAWSALPDCTLVAEVSGDVGGQILLPQPAVLAGGDMTGRPRTLGVVHPNNPEYTKCVDVSIARIEAAGYEVALRQNYTLDLAATSSNAASILARLKDAEITSVACACDPLMMQALAAAAEAQEYYPEWFIVGVGYIDLDIVGQMIAAPSGSQWTRAIGGSPSAAPVPFGESEAYHAYRTVRDDEPSIAVDVIYAQLMRLAIGIQMAGPELTPQTFETGLFNYPEGDGLLGAWDFGPDNRSGLIDVRLVFWQPDIPSPFNGAPGTYVDTGQRFRDIAEAPTQDELLEFGEQLGVVPGDETDGGTVAADTTEASG